MRYLIQLFSGERFISARAVTEADPVKALKLFVRRETRQSRRGLSGGEEFHVYEYVDGAPFLGRYAPNESSFILLNDSAPSAAPASGAETASAAATNGGAPFSSQS